MVSDLQLFIMGATNRLRGYKEDFMVRLPIRILAMAAGATLVSAFFACKAEERPPRVEPSGEPVTAKTRVLRAGAEILQDNTPARQLDIYLVGFHPMKDNPHHQMEAHHYCRQVNEDFAQCALWDGNTKYANLSGIEYIISERLFETLPEDERQLWHPHNYEILSGQLVAPGLPERAELALMKGKMNSYGKTWHVWNTGAWGIRGDELPLGKPHLAWSFNADGEALPGLVKTRDRSMNLDSLAIRKQRKELIELAHPQEGVDALAKSFPERQKPLGVRAKAAAGKARH
jgi:hypothetical protein